ncbi:hypothetical protein B566_EDAN014382 [Ephemera danica]|nr:hypothetical protein B566_EDAN014382 [Ephemera danica]
MSTEGAMEVQCEDSSPAPVHRTCLRNVLERPGPFCLPDFDPSPGTLLSMLPKCRILVVGAGGLGCELLKDLALMGFADIEVIDMDTIELSNLNRQFLFRRKDIGKSKAEVAAAFINNRIPGVRVKPHFCRIQDKDEDFYRQFHVVVCGLDSVPARRWLNGMLVSLLVYEDGTLDESSVIPLIDGGTEGLKGNARVIMPGISACIECTLGLYPPQVTYPLCTIANTPRLPEHCIEYVKIIQWPKDNPFACEIDGIVGVDYKLVQGVVKNIIPAVASTNAVIAAACTTEVFKLATSLCKPLNNYMVFNNADGIYSYSYPNEKKEDCLVCSQVPIKLKSKPDARLEELIATLCSDEEGGFRMKSPALTAVIEGKHRTLYMSTVPSIERQTRDNLKKTLTELGLSDGSEIVVADETSPLSITFHVSFNK